MFSKIIMWTIRFTPILGLLEHDLESTITAIESDKHLAAKVTVAVEGLLEVLEEVVKVTG